MNNRHRISMRLDIYLFEFYLIYTFTKQCKEEVDGNLSICLDDPKTSVARSCSYQVTTLITSLKVWNFYWRGVPDPQIWLSKPLQEPRYKQPRIMVALLAFFSTLIMVTRNKTKNTCSRAPATIDCAVGEKSKCNMLNFNNTCHRKLE